jgi:hypothetical protein
MAIQEVKKGGEIKDGMWICTESNIINGLCSAPRQVLRIKGDRIYTTNRHGEDDGSFITRKTVLYACDTRDEANSLHQVSRENVAAISASVKAIAEANEARLKALITG